MTEEGPQETVDALLGGRVRLTQPRTGYRAGTDPVLLAAAVPARPGQRVLDLGCGAGAAALCLAARVQGLELHGIEVQPGYAELARRNAALNGLAVEVHEGDIGAMPAALKAISFDHVMMNPPFYADARATAPADPGKARAYLEGEVAVEGWIRAGLRRLRDRGSLTIVHRTERLAEILAALTGPAGAITVLPLVGRAGRAAGRVIVQARKASRTPLQLLSPLVVHDGAQHRDGPDGFSATARSVLMEAAPLAMG